MLAESGCDMFMMQLQYVFRRVQVTGLAVQQSVPRTNHPSTAGSHLQGLRRALGRTATTTSVVR